MSFGRALMIGVLLGSALPRAAGAEEKVDYTKRLAILPIVVDGPEGSISLSALFGAITAAVKTRADLRVIGYEEMFVAASQEGLADQIVDCGMDDECRARRLRRFNARYGVVVVLNFEVSPVLMTVQVLDTDSRKKVAERLLEFGSKDTTIVERLEQEADALLTEIGFLKSGRLVVKADPPAATIALERGNPPDLGTAGIFTVEPGRYVVRATAPGWDAAQATVDVKSGEVVNVELALAQQTSWWESPWLWVAAGIVVAGTTTAVVVTTQQPDPCFCVTFRGDGCGCPP